MTDQQPKALQLAAGKEHQAMLAAAPQPPTTEQSSAVDQPESAYLLHDLANELNVGAIELIAAIRDAGFGDFSVNMELPAAICVAMCFRFGDVQPQGEQAPVANCTVRPLQGNEAYPKVTVKWVGRPVPGPLYTHPQPPRQPLTDEQRRQIWRDSPFRGNGGQIDWFIEGTRAAERAHGIGQEAAPQQSQTYDHAANERFRAELQTQKIEQLNAERDKLLAALEALADYVDERTSDNECRPLENARAVIAQVGGAA